VFRLVQSRIDKQLIDVRVWINLIIRYLFFFFDFLSELK